MRTQTIEILADPERTTKHQIWKLLEPNSILTIKDIYFSDPNSEAFFLLILRTTEDSPEHLDDIILTVTDNEAQIPVCSFDTNLYRLEVVTLSVDVKDQKQNLEIKIEYY